MKDKILSDLLKESLGGDKKKEGAVSMTIVEAADPKEEVMSMIDKMGCSDEDKSKIMAILDKYKAPEMEEEEEY